MKRASHSSAKPSTTTKLRWDRVFLVSMILVGCSSGVVALVGSTEEEMEEFTRLTHPKPLAELQRKQATMLALRSEGVPEHQANEAPKEAPRATERDKSIQPCSVCKRTMRVPRNPYTSHQAAARSLPNSFFVKNDIELGAGKRNGKLVEVKDGRGFRVAPLTHSHPWLLPETYQLLQDMGNDFADALEGTASEGAVFRVTSVTRTEKQQRKLRRRNLNATISKSTHSYGASFDIAFVDRWDDNASCGTPTREMERLLNRYQDAGIIYVIPEGGCMHVTLRKPQG